jgi:hypothetical protein
MKLFYYILTDESYHVVYTFMSRIIVCIFMFHTKLPVSKDVSEICTVIANSQSFVCLYMLLPIYMP